MMPRDTAARSAAVPRPVSARTGVLWRIVRAASLPLRLLRGAPLPRTPRRPD